MTQEPIKKGLLKRLLFLEITGILSLLLTVTVSVLLISLKMLSTDALIIPSLAFLVVFVFIVISIRYARRDIHKIHELHDRGFYPMGRLLVYAIGVAMIGYTFFLLFTQKDFFTSIGSIIEAEMILVLGILIMYYTYTLHYLIKNEHLRHEHANFFDFFWVMIFPIILVAGSVFFLFSQTTEAVVSGRPDFEVTAGKILAEFEKNDSVANLKYLNKKIKLASHVVEITGDSSILLKLAGGIEGVTINCGFDKSQKDKIAAIIEGDSVVVLCSCGGFTKPKDAGSLLSEKYLELNSCNLLQQITLKPSIGTDIENPNIDSGKK